MPRLPRPPWPLRAFELHESGRPSATAEATALGRALELLRPDDDRIVTDTYAPAFLSVPARRALSFLRSAAPLLHAAERNELTGIATSALCRHRFIDERLLESLPDVAQVMILGAGYDSRAYRFARPIGARPVYEVDLAPLSRRKADIVARDSLRFGRSRVTRVETDFRGDDLAVQLADRGFERGAPTFVVWEGVAMYLTASAVHETLDVLRRICGAGSVLAMDLWQHVGGVRPADQVRRFGVQGLRLIGEPIDFAVPATAAGDLLQRHGFQVLTLETAERMTKRYARAGRRCDEGMFVLAARRT